MIARTESVSSSQRTRRILFALSVSTIFWAAVITAVVVHWGISEKLSTREVSREPLKSSDLIWLTDSGDVVAMERNGRDVLLTVWKPDGMSGGSVNVIQLPEPEGKAKYESLVAVARNLTQVVWMSPEQGIKISDLPRIRWKSFRMRSPAPGSLVVTETGEIFVGDAFGVYRVDPRRGGMMGRLVDAPPADELVTSGKWVAAQPPTRDSVYLFDTSQNQGRRIAVSAALYMALARSGAVAVVDKNHSVILDDAGSTGFVTVPGPVSSIVFDEKSQLIATELNGSGTYALHRGSPPQKIADTPSGATLVGARGADIICVSSGRTELLTFRASKSRELSRFGMYASGIGMFLIACNWIYGFLALRKRTPAAPVTLPMTTQQRLVYDLPMPQPPPELVNACSAGECVLYVGAGIAAQAGLPTWRSLIRRLLDFAMRQEFVDSSQGESLSNALESGQYETVADNLANVMHERQDALKEFLSEIFAPQSYSPPPIYSTLAQIHPGAVLTSNFDDLLERTFEKQAAERRFAATEPGDMERLLAALNKREFFILKLYGTLERPRSLVFAPQQYGDLIAENRVLSQFMDALFLSRTLLFVGASLQGIEDYLKNTLRGASRQQSPRPHYALVAVSDDSWQVHAQLLQRRYNIQVLPFTPSENFPEVLQFFKLLGQAVESPLQSAILPTSDPLISPIRRIRLENIGPFDSLEINLDAHWNVLLGDNGVGKSSILKALALAIVGKDGAGLADRMIKAGRSSASVTLMTDRGNYVTEIYRGTTAAEVVSRPGRPLEIEGWLAVGFPPLRHASWELPKGPQPIGKSIPTSADLLPLIKGDPDPRIDKLKQWIVDIYYQMKDEESKGNGNSRYHKLFTKFFEIVDQLTPGVSIEFKEVDSATKQVRVKTADGVIPIEAVSQGTTSLISWVGVLLQRLYEIYGDIDGDPAQRFAIVLIDEIDAHMHPEWQQLLVHELAEIFPNIQFVATTHSPLIVDGMTPSQIVRLRRSGSGEIELIAVSQDMTIGRADQILTGPLFNLRSARGSASRDLLGRYTELAAKQSLSESEKQELQAAARALKINMPSDEQEEISIKAFDMLRDALDERMAKLSPDKKRELVNELKVQMKESVTGSRRPL